MRQRKREAVRSSSWVGVTHRLGHSEAHDDGCRLPLPQPHQVAWHKWTDSSDANALQPNVVETDGAQSSGLNETVEKEVENRLGV